MRFRLRALCVALLGVSLSASAAGPDPVAQARAAIASASFERAISIADKGLKSAKTATRRGQLELIRGECFHALRKSAQLKEALSAALTHDPLAAYDAASVNPELVAGLEEQRQALAGRLIISGSFSGNDAPLVTMDDVNVGLAPVSTPANVGRHRVKIGWPGGDTQEESVVIRANTDSTLVLSRAGPSSLSGPPLVVERAAEPELTPGPAPGEPAPQPFSTAKRAERPSPSRWPWAAMGVGAVFVVSGVVCLGVAASRYNALTGGAGVSTLQLDGPGAAAYAAQGQTIQTVGIALTVLGALAAGVGGVGLVLGSDDGRVALSVGPHGVAIAGVLP